MTVRLGRGTDLNVDVVRRVAWRGEPVTLTDAAIEAIGRQRRRFLEFVRANGERHLYGITTRHHTGATHLLDAREREEYGRHIGSAPSSTGPGLPDRVLRAVVLARLTDILNGTAAVRPETAAALVAMLDGPMPYVPERGHGEPGNIIALGHLLRPRFVGHVQIGEGMALINGSPVASAVLADAVLAGRGHISAAERVLALSAVAGEVPATHYDERLAQLWRDEHQSASLRRLRELMAGADRPELAYQAAVSFRSAPRVLGWLRRTQAHAEDCATISLSASSNNPAFVGPEISPPLGDVLSNGGYHNPMAAPCLDALTRAWADVGQLVTAQVGRLVHKPDGIVATESQAQVSLFDMASAGWAEEARAAAQPSLIGLGPAGRTDTTTSEVPAWRRSRDAGEALVANLAVLAVVAAHTIARRDGTAPPGLAGLAAAVLDFPLDARPTDFGAALSAVQDHLLDRAGDGVAAAEPEATHRR